MNKAAAEKHKQLGMPMGTAANRLRKMIMLHLLQRLGEDVCFVCSLPITAVEELTIEHRKPWMYAGPELFWDLANIAFSHGHCNTTHRPAYGQRVKTKPGFSWCAKCEQEKPTAEFAKRKIRWNQCSVRCLKCRRVDDKRRRTTPAGPKRRRKETLSGEEALAGYELAKKLKTSGDLEGARKVRLLDSDRKLLGLE